MHSTHRWELVLAYVEYVYTQVAVDSGACLLDAMKGTFWSHDCA